MIIWNAQDIKNTYEEDDDKDTLQSLCKKYLESDFKPIMRVVKEDPGDISFGIGIVIIFLIIIFIAIHFIH